MSGKKSRTDYQREYQRTYYISGSRVTDKKEYYKANSKIILGRQHYTKMARIFRNIMANV